MLRRVYISGLAIDPQTNSPIIILKEMDGIRSLPIWIGLLEATAIASELENIKFPRPMTHDLLKNILDQVGLSVNKIEVCDLKDNTFYALIYLQYKEKEIAIDSRPSDAIALALRTEAPIYVNEAVLEKSGLKESNAEEGIQDEEARKWTEILESLDPEDFGKYKM